MLPGPECVAFTLNCTHAVNYVLKGLLRPGDHVVVSCLEHNAVIRPLPALRPFGITYTEAEVFPGDNDSYGQCVPRGTAAEHETGHVHPCFQCMGNPPAGGTHRRACRINMEFRLRWTALSPPGLLPIDMKDSGIDYLCVAGHKGLYGPMGTGMLITPNGSDLATVIEGGTGTESIRTEQPSGMPERMESGTQNMPGIAGLRAGIGFVRRRRPEKILEHETSLLRALYQQLASMNGVQLYTPMPDTRYFVPVLSFNIKGMQSETVGRELNELGVAVRAGLHCAPAAHRRMGTLESGAVRMCPSVFSTMQDMNGAANAVKRILMKKSAAKH